MVLLNMGNLLRVDKRESLVSSYFALGYVFWVDESDLAELAAGWLQ